jgi:hypothetical protein
VDPGAPEHEPRPCPDGVHAKCRIMVETGALALGWTYGPYALTVAAPSSGQVLSQWSQSQWWRCACAAGRLQRQLYRACCGMALRVTVSAAWAAWQCVLGSGAVAALSR